jgi:hypothetical protein
LAFVTAEAVAVGDEVEEVDVEVEFALVPLAESLLWTNARATLPYSLG